MNCFFKNAAERELEEWLALRGFGILTNLQFIKLKVFVILIVNLHL